MRLSPRPGLVFISYKREEAAAAGRLREALVQEGFNVWWDEDLQCGQAWAEKLDAAVREAACIIVLWSARAVVSPWVRHEASQAIVRDVYAPCRIELVQLGSPYDRIQATDLIDWDGDRAQAGFSNLLSRVNTLVPAPVSRPRRIGQWLRANLIMLAASLVASGIAAAALGLLWIIFDAQRADRLEKVYDCSASRELRTILALERYSKGKQLQNVCLSRADLSKAYLFKANLIGANLREANLIEANLIEANLYGVDLTEVDLSEANLTGANLTGANLTGANLTGANLSGANLTVANLTEADLSEANLAGANLTVANLTEADLSEANLAKAHLFKADLIKANLAKANLIKANLTKVKLTNTDLSEADLTGVKLTRACADQMPIAWPKNYAPLRQCQGELRPK